MITDHFVICSGNNERQARTISEEIERSLSADYGVEPFRREGEREGRWILLDYVDFVVHIFLGEVRDYYDLERLWSDAPMIPFVEGEEGEDESAASQEATEPQKTEYA